MVDPGPTPHVGGPIVETLQSFLCVEGVPVATVGDECLCTGVPMRNSIASGSAVATIDGRKIARLGDSCSHGGKLAQGVPWLTFD
ncbi:PAAR domain-containing protein [Mesorhizobium sp. SB112]|uniref:PAAR domain-containing protein n=1 Tax=Mesorhizobium sp. SB112 TaxID=3151853 RepID=UPI003263C00A